MKTLENIQDLKKLLLNPYTIYTYDYAGGLIINDTTDYIEIYEIEIEDEPFDEFLGNIITYASEKDLFENLRENLIRMDLTKGADDQYYDYSPSQVEAILFGILQLTPEHQDIIVIDLNEEILEFISGLDYIGNLPTVPDLGKPIEIQVSTTRQIPLEQNKEVQTKIKEIIKEIIYNNLYDTLIDELKDTISRFQAQYNIQEINPYLLQNPEDLVSLSQHHKR